MTAPKLLRLASWIAAMSLAAQFAHAVRAQQTTTLQRSDAIYNLKTTAEGGSGRGEEIYYFYETSGDNVIKIDRDSGQIERTYPIKTGDAYDNS